MIKQSQPGRIHIQRFRKTQDTPARSGFYTALLSGLLICGPIQADDVEIYSDTSSNGVNPNILFVIDTSGSMGGTVNISSYDPGVSYDVPVGAPAGSVECLDDRIYVGGIGTTTPQCDTNYWFEESKFHCDAGAANLDINGVGLGTGFYVDRIARWNDTFDSWYSLHSTFYNFRSTSLYYECEDDDEIHGKNGTNTAKRIRNGSSGPWNSVISDNIWSNKTSRTIFSGNYLNWFHYHGGATATGTIKTRLQVVVDAAKNLIDSVGDLNIGLMRFDSTSTVYETVDDGFHGNNHGGPISHPLVDISTAANKTLLKDTLDAFTFGGSTPLVETVYEGMRYYRGENVHFGLPQPDGTLTSHVDSRTGNVYDSPILTDCGKNYMVVFSDGAPTADFDADGFISPLINGISGDMGSCSHGATTYFAGDSCLDELANFMFIDDHATVDEGNNLPGEQNIVSYYVSGFDGADDALMAAAAAKGGTISNYSAATPSSFASVFNTILADIQKSNAAFTSPAVSVNALNRLRHNNDLYFALFEPNSSPHWVGNIKKYKLEASGLDVAPADGEDDFVFIGDAQTPTQVAVDPTTGLFEESALSYWFLDATDPDGDETGKGGAAHRLYDYDDTSDLFDASTRGSKVFTYLSDYPPDATEFDGSGISLIAIHENNADVTGTDPDKISKATLGLVSTFDDNAFLDRVKWARGVDVSDADQDSNLTEGRPGMGGVLHTEPVLINYATDPTPAPGFPDGTQTNVLFTTTNDGYFHIFKSEDAGLTRLEHSAVIPKPVLGQIDELYLNTGSEIAYRLDGNIDIWRNDSDNDGFITTGGSDHVYAYFGQRRGGNNIFAFDVTDPDLPRLLWEINPDLLLPADLTDDDIGPFQYMGQTWSKPRHHRLLLPNIAGTDLELRDIIIFGGGYDHDKDDLKDQDRDEDTFGNAIYIVDAETGELIWWAGKSGLANVTPDLPSADMKYGFASDIRIADINGDSIADIMFATDGGGQVWRFDINNALNVGDPLTLASRISGGAVADLQLTSSSDTSTDLNNRRLYYAPDVAIAQRGDEDPPFFTVAVGSGFRASPLNKTIADKFFVLKYADVNAAPASYSAVKIYVDDLLDVTSLNFAANPPPTLTTAEETSLNNKGWFIDLTDSGEKVLSESITVDGNVIFSTYTPPTTITNPNITDLCLPNQGAGRTYFVSVFDASPVANLDGLNGDTNLTLPDRAYNLTVSGVPPKPKVIFPDLDKVSGKVIVGREILPVNIANDAELTFWLQQ